MSLTSFLPSAPLTFRRSPADVCLWQNCLHKQLSALQQHCRNSNSHHLQLCKPTKTRAALFSEIHQLEFSAVLTGYDTWPCPVFTDTNLLLHSFSCENAKFFENFLKMPYTNNLYIHSYLTNSGTGQQRKKSGSKSNEVIDGLKGIRKWDNEKLRAVWGAGQQPPNCWDHGPESRWWHGCESLVFAVYCVGSYLCEKLITRRGESYRARARVCVCVLARV